MNIYELRLTRKKPAAGMVYAAIAVASHTEDARQLIADEVDAENSRVWLHASGASCREIGKANDHQKEGLILKAVSGN